MQINIESKNQNDIELPAGLNDIEDKEKFKPVYKTIKQEHPYINESYYNAIKSAWKLNHNYSNAVNNLENGLLNIRYSGLENMIKIIRQSSSIKQQKEMRISLIKIKNTIGHLSTKQSEIICNYLKGIINSKKFYGNNKISKELELELELESKDEINVDTTTRLEELKSKIENKENEKITNTNNNTPRNIEQKTPENNIELSESFKKIQFDLDNDEEIKNIEKDSTSIKTAKNYISLLSQECEGIDINDEDYTAIYLSIKKDYIDILNGDTDNIINKVNDIRVSLIELHPDLMCIRMKEVLPDMNKIKAKLNIDDIELSENDINDSEKLTRFFINSDIKETEVIDLLKTKIALDKKKEKNENLSPEEEKIYKKIKDIILITKKVIEIQDFKENTLKEDLNRHHHHDINYNQELSTNIKSLSPQTIIEGNISIHKFIYGNEKHKSKVELSNKQPTKDEIEKFLPIIKKERESDKGFTYSLKFFNSDLSINIKKANENNIDIKSLEKEQEKILKEIQNKINQEKLNQEKESDKQEIFDTIRKRSIMTCCLHAISKYFDKGNTNGENFANQFEIGDLNENINFDENTKVLKMTGKIGANKNHIGLYYNLETGELSFDNFLAKDPHGDGFVIGTGNGITETLNINLPTLNEMNRRISSKELIYNHIFKDDNTKLLGKVMTQDIRLGCFIGFIGTDIDVNKQVVQEFNEKNILKQDIIKNIYSTYYDQGSLNKIVTTKLNINEGNTPEQYKLIKLISDSIDNCGNAHELLRFRNLVNEFNDLLNSTSNNYIKNDFLLTYLFANNIKQENDNYDISKKNLEIENGDNHLTFNSENSNYEINSIINSNQTSINYFTFLNLLSENKQGINRYINLNTFEQAINTIKKDGIQLENLDNNIFTDNLENSNLKNDLADFKLSQTIQNI